MFHVEHSPVLEQQLAVAADWPDDQVARFLTGFLNHPNDWMSNDNRMCSHAAMAMRAEGYPDRDILAIVIRLLHADTSWSKL